MTTNKMIIYYSNYVGDDCEMQAQIDWRGQRKEVLVERAILIRMFPLPSSCGS